MISATGAQHRIHSPPRPLRHTGRRRQDRTEPPQDICEAAVNGHAPRRYLSGGIQSFRKIRADNYYYVDKTAYAGRLAAPGFRHWFLSRPRRFGKGLFADTLKELFDGREALFRGLTIHDKWDWSVRHPVLRISFGAGRFDGPDGPRTTIDDLLITIEDDAGVTARHATANARLAHVIRALHERTGQKVVLLVDE